MVTPPNKEEHGYLSTKGSLLIDSKGKKVRLVGLNWSGFETSQLVLFGLNRRSLRSYIHQISSLGSNSIRIPFCQYILHVDQKSFLVDHKVLRGINRQENPELVGLTSLEILDAFVSICSEYRIKVILCKYSSLPDVSLEKFWYSPSDLFYTQQRWIDDLVS